MIPRELRVKVCSLSTKVEKAGKLDTELKSAFFACQTLEDVEHLVWLVYVLFANISMMYLTFPLDAFFITLTLWCIGLISYREHNLIGFFF